ncbi:MAG: hypothetical protein IJJ69_10310 [Oscillospiraceae bacterium]|nr:hypothetical protein [Oscillospiraceae bacterium]
MKKNIPVRFLTAQDYYSVFSPAFAKQIDAQTEAKRKNIENKLRQIHEIVYPQIKPFGYACHYRKQNITTSSSPDMYNDFSVDWIGVKYVKGFSEENKDLLPFQKMASLQFGIDEKGFFAGFHFAVAEDAYDRQKLSQHNYSMLKRYKTRIENELRKLTGENYVWEVYGAPDGKMPIREDTVENFCDWFQKTDKNGFHSGVHQYQDENLILKEPAVIAGEVRRVMLKLHPLYCAMTGR